MVENVAEKLSAIQNKENVTKTSLRAKKQVPDYKPEPEHDKEERKSSFRSDISNNNGKDLCPIDVAPGYVLVQIRKDGVTHRRMYSEKQIKDETKANGGFLPITYDSDGKSAIIDYDQDKGRFYVKAFLANVNNLKEIRLLKIAIWMIGGGIFLSIVFFAVLLYSISSMEQRLTKSIISSISSQSEQLRKAAESTANLQRTLQAPDPTEAVTNDTEPVSKGTENSHPGRLLR